MEGETRQAGGRRQAKLLAVAASAILTRREGAKQSFPLRG